MEDDDRDISEQLDQHQHQHTHQHPLQQPHQHSHQHQQTTSFILEVTETQKDDVHTSPSKLTHRGSTSFELLEPHNDEYPTTVAKEISLFQSKFKGDIDLNNYWRLLLIITLFYLLPSSQFVLFQYQYSETGAVTCYFNFKCAKPLLGFKAFNNVISNISYLFFGCVLFIFIWSTAPKKDKLVGLHTDMSLFYSLILALIFEGIFSALYHVCPTVVNYQFDTSFMIIGGGLAFICLYQRRHPYYTPDAFKAYSIFALMIFLILLSLFSLPSFAFWLTVVVVVTAVVTGTCMYIYEQRPLWKMEIRDYDIIKKIKNRELITQPRNSSLLILLVFVAFGDISMTIAMAIFGIINDDINTVFSLYMIAIIIFTFVNYSVYYIIMKFKHGEAVSLFSILLLFLISIVWGIAIYLFQDQVSDKFSTIEESNKLNRDCVLFQYFDTHDIWHMTSSLGIALVIVSLYILDWDIQNTPRELIALF